MDIPPHATPTPNHSPPADVYDRLTPPGRKPTVMTLMGTQLVSGVWHGLFPGYWAFFATSAVFLEASKVIYRCVGPGKESRGWSVLPCHKHTPPCMHAGVGRGACKGGTARQAIQRGRDPRTGSTPRSEHRGQLPSMHSKLRLHTHNAHAGMSRAGRPGSKNSCPGAC